MALLAPGVPIKLTPSVQRATSSLPTTTRRHELDWLRALAVLGLIPFHAAVIFTTGSGDYIKSTQTSVSMDLLASFISLWGIQLLFFIGGAAAFFALHRRSSRQYVSERFTRLAVPFGFGVLTIVPLQIYVGYLATPGAHMSFWRYYGAVYLQRWLGILHGVIPANGDNWVGHLWFIPPLILFSLLALPVYRLSGRLPEQLKKQGAEICSGWRMLLLFGLPLGLIKSPAAQQLPQVAVARLPALRELGRVRVFLALLLLRLHHLLKLSYHPVRTSLCVGSDRSG